jgi:ABC-type cobalamin/Fe3+-siderophores transport system ATPase subunit
MQLKLDLENCYGIKKLKTDFDFSKSKAYAIYAPNGAMKTSLAKTFQDIADNAPTKDRIFGGRVSRRVVTDGASTNLPPESVLVVRPYDEVLGHSEKTSTLLVNAKLREEYEKLYGEIDAAKDRLLKAVKTRSGSKRDIEKEISFTFTRSEEKFQIALTRINAELLAQKDAPFADVRYDTIFDDKVLNVLNTKDFKTAIEDYITKYNELLAASTYFKQGTFTYYNASMIAKSLADNGFFKAKHSINLNSDTRLEINTEKQLEDLVAKEKEGISNDKDLRTKFAELDKLLIKNANVRDFQAYLEGHVELLPSLANIDVFKEEVWKSYLYAEMDLYNDLMDKYAAVERRKLEIEAQAAKERTQWEEVIDTFNSRFFVPFKLVAKNQIDVILGRDKILRLGFTFEDGADTADLERAALIDILSTGEKKALYILNIIFEIQVRIKARQNTILVVDDIADSFDYRNKYAIIQYLKDISDDPHFNQIILTHNFDFFRTINSRFIQYSFCYMASKNSSGLTLSKAAGIKNIFVNDWKKEFFLDPKKRIASIPFIRNLIEFTRGDQDADFVKLTSLLHWKNDSVTITEEDLATVYNTLFRATGAAPDGKKAVVDLIQEHANNCLTAQEGINFENKIVLSIAIRLQAEKFMVDKINDAAFVRSVKANQTPALLMEFKKRHSASSATIRIIEKVILMTPENIHLNSFMYEPILDMSDEHLRKLYDEVLLLA